jgi:hypothetical protein
MEKTNLAKAHKSYYKAKAKPELVTIEKAQYLSIKGKGDPNGQAFADRIQALYSTAYTLKFIFKELQQDFTVPKLEALWWFDIDQYGGLSLAEVPQKVPRNEWEYRLLIRMPDFVTAKEMEEAVQTVICSKRLQLAAAVEWYRMAGGKYVQMLHVGPFENEPETLLQMQAFMQEKGLQKSRLHHEVYLSDFRLTPPEKFKTILREPIK